MRSMKRVQKSHTQKHIISPYFGFSTGKKRTNPSALSQSPKINEELTQWDFLRWTIGQVFIMALAYVWEYSMLSSPSWLWINKFRKLLIYVRIWMNFERHCARWKKPGTMNEVSYGSTAMKCIEKENSWGQNQVAGGQGSSNWGGEGRRNGNDSNECGIISWGWEVIENILKLL